MITEAFEEQAKKLRQLLSDPGYAAWYSVIAELLKHRKRVEQESIRYFFLKRILGIEYYHDTQLAPNKEILDGYKDKAISWEQYETNFLALLKQRDPKILNDIKLFDEACLLCSEDKPDHCHRRLVAEYIQEVNPQEKIEIIHI
ncbi:DUF488 domain-containing protein [Paradesulfitobacterium ferrireducens]|uniref:DUF488 domain-containing protein n=1 Tax=Paradesulfitobacterium ferrireducens TaxID=2816476 RepID=UPI001A8EE801|nr:DUF488 domain-containing protein [Paradesulfitobacterium ferrireducens]